jgi:phosphoribosylcarboxyaminoimidazole (NCAIR) mutase
MDSLLSISQMPRGVPVACMSIGKHGAVNAALFAKRILECHKNNQPIWYPDEDHEIWRDD